VCESKPRDWTISLISSAANISSLFSTQSLDRRTNTLTSFLIARFDIIAATAGLYVAHRMGRLFEPSLAPTRASNQHLED
jgi:hypothetical protein